MNLKYNILERRSKDYSIVTWVCLLVYLSTLATTANGVIENIADYETLNDKDYYDPCSSDFLRTIVHGVVSILGSCGTSPVISDKITNTIVGSVPELNLHDYLIIVCPATRVISNSDTTKCLYSVHVTERRNNMIVTNSRLTRISTAALQPKFTSVTMLEPENGNKGSRYIRASDGDMGSGDMGSGDMGSGDMGSGTESTDDNQSSDVGGLKEWHIGVITIGALLVVLSCILILMIFYFVHERRLSKRHSSQSSFPITFDDGDLELHPITPQVPKKISRFSFRHFSSPVLTNLLDMDRLKQMLDNYTVIEEEYSKLPRNTITVEHIPAGVIYKNRYIDILPNPRTRVALYLQSGVANSDYINANFIRGYRMANKQYIATQGPLPGTLEDFWRLIWEQRCSIIVMLTNLVEMGKEKCCKYWPDESVNCTSVFGDLIVSSGKVQTKPNFQMTTLLVQHKDKAVSREITHFWFTSWPDHGVPETTAPVIAFIREVRNHQNEIPGPVLVHCSAGIGRTGVFISSDVGMRQLEENNKVDILRIVSTLRQDRGGMVQTVSQYHFVYKLLYDYGRCLQRMSSSQLAHQQQQQQQQLQVVTETSSDDTSDTDHNGHESQASLII